MSGSPSPEQLSRLVLQSSKDGILAFDLECRYTVWNTAMELIAGMSAHEVIGRVAWEAFPFLKDIGEDQLFHRALAGETAVAYMRPFTVPSSGKSGFFEGYYSPLRDENGEIIGGVGVIRDVTDRARARADDELFRTIAETIPHIVWVAKADGGVEYYNQSWYDYTGRGRTPVPDERDYLEVVHPDDRAQIRKAAEGLLGRGEDFEYEYRLRNREGEYRWFLGRGISIRDSQGRVIRRIGTATDVHDQKTAAEEAFTSSERFRVLVEQTPFAFQLYNPDGLCTYANPAWEKIWMSDRKELEGYNILQDPHVQKHGVGNLLRRAFAGEPITFPDVYYDPRLAGKVGRPRWIRTHFFPVQGRDGRLNQVAEVLEDITSDIQARERTAFLSEASKVMAESLELDKTLSSVARLCVSRIADICIIDLLNPDGSFRRVEVAVSEQFTPALMEEVRKMPPRASEHQHPAMIAHLEQRTVFLRGLVPSEVLARQGVDPARRKAVEAFNVHTVVAIPLRARGHSLGVMSVMCSALSGRAFSESEVSWLEEVAERTAIAIDNANLYQASRQAVVARDTFMSTASHELKTPLTALQLQLNIVSRLLGAQAPDRESGQRIKSFTLQTDRQIHRLSRLVDDMLDISRIASGRLRVEPESIDLTELTREVCSRLQPLANDYETSVQIVSTEPVFGEWDGHRIEQVLTNLLTNAFRYGGKNPIEVRVWEHGEDAFISVRDQGKGIAKGDQERIFQRFERAVHNNEVSGFGLGLYIAKEIVTLHRGTIDVQSEPGSGSTFTIRLPLHPPPEE